MPNDCEHRSYGLQYHFQRGEKNTSPQHPFSPVAQPTNHLNKILAGRSNATDAVSPRTPADDSRPLECVDFMCHSPDFACPELFFYVTLFLSNAAVCRNHPNAENGEVRSVLPVQPDLTHRQAVADEPLRVHRVYREPSAASRPLATFSLRFRNFRQAAASRGKP